METLHSSFLLTASAPNKPKPKALVLLHFPEQDQTAKRVVCIPSSLGCVVLDRLGAFVFAFYILLVGSAAFAIVSAFSFAVSVTDRQFYREPKRRFNPRSGAPSVRLLSLVCWCRPLRTCLPVHCKRTSRSGRSFHSGPKASSGASRAGCGLGAPVGHLLIRAPGLLKRARAALSFVACLHRTSFRNSGTFF